MVPKGPTTSSGSQARLVAYHSSVRYCQRTSVVALLLATLR